MQPSLLLYENHPFEEDVLNLARAMASPSETDKSHALAFTKQWSIHHQSSALLLRVIWFLRNRLSSESQIAELCIYCADIECMRGEILLNAANSLAYTAKPRQALDYLEQGLREARFGAHGVLFAALQYARIGERDYALRWLSHSAEMEPEIATEATTTLQFFRFLWKYDEASSRRMLESVFQSYRKVEARGVERDVRHALSQGDAYLLLRLGDGEGSCIRHNLEDEEEFNALYRSNREEFFKIWFEDTSVCRTQGFDVAIHAFNNAIAHANCLGGLYEAAIKCEYDLGSRRGIAWVVNTLRKALTLAEVDPDHAGKTGVCDLTIHYDLLLSGALSRILQDREQLGLISCHSDLPHLLQRKFKIRDVEFHKIPGEQGHSKELGETASMGRHWPDRYREICAVCDEGDRRGQLFLVAAGFLGKIYAAKLKQRGAVVLDIGAVADLWMGKNTRTFPDLPEALRIDV